MKMNPKARAVYHEVLEHWKDILRRAEADMPLPIGPRACSWCLLFNSMQRRSDDCKGCPIYERTGRQYCEGTPYETVDEVYDQRVFKEATKDELCAVVREQLDFLYSFREETDD